MKHPIDLKRANMAGLHLFAANDPKAADAPYAPCLGCMTRPKCSEQRQCFLDRAQVAQPDRRAKREQDLHWQQRNVEDFIGRR